MADLVEEIKNSGGRFRTVDDLWEAIGEDPDRGIQRAAKLTMVPRLRLITLLGAEAVRDSETQAATGLARNALAAALIALCLILTLAGAAARVWLPAPLGANSTAEQVVVSAPGGLAAFHVIAPQEVALEETPAETGAFTETQAVVNGYLLEPVKAGDLLHANQIIAPALLSGRQILTIPGVQVNALGPAVKPGDSIALWFYAPNRAQSTTPVTFNNVIALTLSQQDNAASVTVAALPGDLAGILPLLGKSDVFVLEAPR